MPCNSSRSTHCRCPSGADNDAGSLLAHYDLGAGGRGLTTDCHDGTNTVFVDYSGAGPTTWGGCRIQGFSTGMNYRF
jgi:hypothetical protein